MQIVVVGANQASAPLTIRECLALSQDNVPQALARLQLAAAESFVLSTCNRVEVYALLPDDADPLALTTALWPNATTWLAGADAYFYCYGGADAVRHLFRVAAGLDSLVLGEDQILLQLKLALELARSAATLGPVLHRLGDAALAAGKGVRTGTAISRNNLSVVSVALALAAQELGDLRRVPILVLGAGQTAELALKHLSGERTAPITIVNRTFSRAAALAQRFGVNSLPWDELSDALAHADLLISCTSSPAPVINASLLQRSRPLLALDLAVPRDIDAAGAANVRVHDLSSLEAICAANRQTRAAAVADAEAIVDVAVEQFMSWWRARVVTPTVAALRERADAVCAAEVRQTLARLPGLSAGEQEAVRYLATAVANKLLHDPLVALKSDPDGADLAAAVQRLFRLPEPAQRVPAAPAGPERPLCYQTCYVSCAAQCAQMAAQ